MKTLRLRSVVLGEGDPRIIVSLMARSLGEVRSESVKYAARLADRRNDSAAPAFDILEWRADHLESSSEPEAGPRDAVAALAILREAFPETPVLFTFRSRPEGGEREIAPEASRRLLLAVIGSGLADAVDLELLPSEGHASEVIAAAHAKGVAVVMSSHDFSGTPPEEEILRRLVAMEAAGADVLKVAVMPRNPADVLALLSATARCVARPQSAPIITMSMGGLGAATRLIGAFSGSCATFGALERPSAPGQIGVEELRTALSIVGRAVRGS